MIHRFSDSESEAYLERQPRGTLGMLFRHRVPILVGLGVLLVAAIALVVILPRQFQSSLDVLVRNKLPLSARLTATSQETVDEQRMQSELALLHSPELAAKVVDPEYPAQPDATHTAADISRHQAAVALFSQQLITSVAPNSNIIHIVVTAGDPHRAGELASRLLDVFFASQSEVAHPTPATAFFIGEANRARDNWQQAQLALDTFRLAHPPTPVGSAAEISLQIAALGHQIQRNDDQIDATIGRILTGERKLITIPAHPLDAANKSRARGASMPLLSTAQLNAMLAIYTDEQAILLTRPPTDPDAVRASLALASQIADTNVSLKLAGQAAAPERDPAANSLWQSTTEDITQAGVELKSLYATRTSLNTQLAAFQTNLDAIQRPPATLAGMQSKAATLQSAYRLAEQRANEARIADAMDQQLRLNVAVASRPSFSNTATSPSPWLYAVTIALAVLFLVACLTLFAGMYSGEYDTQEHPEDEYDYEEDPSDVPYTNQYESDPAAHDPQQEIPFPSRIRTSQSGAFLYAAPGASVPTTQPASDTDALVFPDPLPDPLSPKLSEVLSHHPDPLSQPLPQTDSREAIRPDHEAPPEDAEAAESEPAMEPYPTPPSEIFHPHQYQPSGASAEQASNDDFDAPPVFTRPPHAVVPSFFAGPPTGAVVIERAPDEDHDAPSGSPAHEERSTATPLPELAPPPPIEQAPTPVVAAPFVGAPLVEAVAPVPEPEADPVLAVPTPEPEPIVTLPDPTPPWSQPAAAEPKPTPLPPLSYWASAYAAQPPAASEPEAPEAPAVEAATEPVSVAPAAVDRAPSESPSTAPLYSEPAYAAPAPATVEPIPAASAIPQEPPVEKPAPAPVEPRAVVQTFTSTLRPDFFSTSVSSTFAAPVFRLPTAPAQPKPAPAATPKPPVAAPAPPSFQAAPRVPAPDRPLVVSYASEPIELVPDPILPPVNPPYQRPPEQAAAPASPQPAPVDDLADFPLYRPKKTTAPPTPESFDSASSPRVERRTQPRPESSVDLVSDHAVNRPQTYEEMVRALVFPEEFAPYVPPARPTAASPRPPVAPAPVRPPAPPVPPKPAPDDDAPPFNYVRRSAPAPPPVPTPPPTPEPVYTPRPQRQDAETIQNFIRRPSVPLQSTPTAYDDRTTYRPAAPIPERPERPYRPAEPPQRDNRDDRDDRTTYRPAEPPQRSDRLQRDARPQHDDRTTYHPIAPIPPQPATPPPTPSWIDIAPPPPPRGEALDPQKRQPDRISAIRESGSRIFPATDQSGIRLTPSQRMKRARPAPPAAPTYDKDGNVIFDHDKNR